MTTYPPTPGPPEPERPDEGDQGGASGPGSAGHGYEPSEFGPYSGSSIPPPPPPPPAYNRDGSLQGQQPRNGLGTAGMVCGIVAVALSFVVVLNAFTWPLGVLAIVFGSVGWTRANRGQATNKPIAVTGLVLGIVSFFTFCLAYMTLGAGSAGG